MAKPKILEQYAGRLTTDQAAQAIQAALQTARELLEDAHILLQKDRWARAAALSILAIEEAGKVPIVREILLARNPDDLKIAWRSYRSHTKKNVVHIFPVMAKRGAKKLEDFRTIYHDNVEDVHSLDVVKQLAFYSDCCGKCHWSLPSLPHHSRGSSFSRNRASHSGVPLAGSTIMVDGRHKWFGSFAIYVYPCAVDIAFPLYSAPADCRFYDSRCFFPC